MEIGEYHQESETSLFRNLEDFLEMLSVSRLCEVQSNLFAKYLRDPESSSG